MLRGVPVTEPLYDATEMIQMVAKISNQTIRDRVFERYGGGCVYCARLVTDSIGRCGTAMRIDHVWPVSRGGPDEESNYVLACRDCNTAKSDKILWTGWIPPRARSNGGEDGPLAADLRRDAAMVDTSRALAAWWRSYAWRLELDVLQLRAALLSLSRGG